MGLIPLGRPDRYLLAFYEEDLRRGVLTRELAQELIDNLCLLVSTYTRPNLASSLLVGGTLADGSPVENDLTWMFLTSIDHVRMPDPGIGLCVAKNTRDELLSYAVSLIARGNPHPAIYNDEELRGAFAELGFGPEDACNYINTTCAEMNVIGKSKMWTTWPFYNALEVFLSLLDERTAFSDAEELLDAYAEKLDEIVEAYNRRSNLVFLERSRNGGDPLRCSRLVDDCLGRGKSIAQGGACFNVVSPSFVGFPNVADCLSALKRCVFSERKYTLAQVAAAMKRDFAGFEPMRQALSSAAHYGNDDPEADKWMRKLTEKVHDLCSKKLNYFGGPMIPGIFTFNQAASMGKALGASPDGRKAHAALADGVGAVQGRDTSGPTASILSATCWKHSDYLGGIVLNLKLRKDLLTGEKRQALVSLLRIYLERGGQQMQLTTVDCRELEDAVEHPENHRDLLVRIGGYSDWFVKLTPEMQQELIRRTMTEI